MSDESKREGLYSSTEHSYREVMPSLGYDVIEWQPSPDGTGKPTAVCVVMPFKVGGAEGSMMLRLKSRRAVDELIATLERHRDGVWPQE